MKYIMSLALCALITSCSSNEETTQPVQQAITQAVYASGRIYPKNFYRVAAKIPGVVSEIYVQSGDTVRAGMPLIRIRNVGADIALQSAGNLYQLAQENAREDGAFLRSAAAEYESAREKHEYDSVNAAKQLRLLTAKATSQASYDAAATQAEVSFQQRDRAYQSYRSLARRMQIEQQNAKLQIEAQRSNRDDFIIHAVEDGVVYDVSPSIGELVSPQMTLLEIGKAAEYEVELNVDETDIGLVSVAQRVVFTVDAHKNERFEGVITHINPRVSATDKTARVTASIAGTKRVAFLPGMSLEANIIVAEKQRALVIPRDYLKQGSVVLRKSSAGIDTVRVRTSIEDLRFVEVVDGLTIHDVLVK